LNGSTQNGNLQSSPSMAAPAQNTQPGVAPPNPPPPPQPRTVTLPTGTNIAIRLGETLSTDKNYAGDTFRATLDAPVIVDGFVIADKGSKVFGKVVDAQRAGRVKGVAQLQLALTDLNTTDGQRIRVQTSTWDKQGPKSTGQDAAKIGAGAVLGSACAIASWLACTQIMYGELTILPSGSNPPLLTGNRSMRLLRSSA